MNKKMFLDILRTGLSDFPTGVLGDILYEYKDYFDVGIADGKTEEEIISELGSPYDIIDKYRKGHLKEYNPIKDSSNNYENHDFIDAEYSSSTENTHYDNLNYENTQTFNTEDTTSYSDESNSQTKSKSNGRNSNNIIITLIILLLGGIFFGPLFLGLTLGGLGALVGMLAGSFALSLAGIGILFGKVVSNTIGIIVFPSFILDFPNSVLILMVIGCILSFILLILIAYYLIKWCFRLLSKLIELITSKVKGEN
ncbi:DUF1700 domain-containing protein [Clostridium septicum]|uniref:DUF1700 domain-containing protein n=1 Tax=Clostridium septicum TaxID=1504 RepID=A0A9N7PIX0_CLOSE|nr:DUF1700 domain-containing protein [Clostridium septicum]AYE34076.1 hypothetical protein CP523_06120 [Clostridium septicum]MDU1313534.1 DUF1700 domain-containing protein [Clostridium septicum]QAS59445.1 DUF1700 domain-containing protein [Clostridium septicum]UEC21301.1 DUF1700 domain-containing protein [Clostridium septicum]USS00655.1 DUF1700 domain-containing protein [Clostridium septicum]